MLVLISGGALLLFEFTQFADQRLTSKKKKGDINLADHGGSLIYFGKIIKVNKAQRIPFGNMNYGNGFLLTKGF